jgi:glycosyltransferase involved in cell wall biosynthesis
MKILLICSEYPRALAGGEGYAVRMMVKLLREAGHQVRITGIYPASMKKKLHSDDEEFMPIWQGDWPLSWRWARKKLYQTVLKWASNKEIEVVEASFAHGWIAGFGPLPVPVVARVHGSTVIKKRKTKKPVPKDDERLEQQALQRADVVSAVSETIKKDLRKCFSYDQPVTVIPNAVAVPDQAWNPTRPQDVVYAAKLSEIKGIDLMLAAWPRIADHEHKARLHLYGAPDPGFSVSEHLTEQLAARVTVHGAVDHETLQRAFRHATVSVFPSRYEAFGLAQAEAMANGCPVVVSWHGAGPELVQDEHDGLVCRPLEPLGLAEAVCRVLDGQSLRRKCSENAKKRIAELCDPQRVLTETVDLYQRAIGEFS